MKIRSGFVSNSSSSSFCVHGTTIDCDEIMDMLDAIDKAFPNNDEIDVLVKACNTEYEDGSLFECGHLASVLSKVFAHTQISYILDWEGEQIWIGRGYETLKDDETGAQFKKSAEDEIRKYLPFTTMEFINEEIHC